MWRWLVTFVTPHPRGSPEVSRSDDDGPALTTSKLSSAPDHLPPPLRVLHWTARDV